jgi:hypothetical protein
MIFDNRYIDFSIIIDHFLIIIDAFSIIYKYLWNHPAKDKKINLIIIKLAFLIIKLYILIIILYFIIFIQRQFYFDRQTNIEWISDFFIYVFLIIKLIFSFINLIFSSIIQFNSHIRHNIIWLSNLSF